MHAADSRRVEFRSGRLPAPKYQGSGNPPPLCHARTDPHRGVPARGPRVDGGPATVVGEAFTPHSHIRSHPITPPFTPPSHLRSRPLHTSVHTPFTPPFTPPSHLRLRPLQASVHTPFTTPSPQVGCLPGKVVGAACGHAHSVVALEDGSAWASGSWLKVAPALCASSAPWPAGGSCREGQGLSTPPAAHPRQLGLLERRSGWRFLKGSPRQRVLLFQPIGTLYTPVTPCSHLVPPTGGATTATCSSACATARSSR